jgi:DNA transformation protein
MLYWYAKKGLKNMKNNDYACYVLDLLEPLGNIKSRKMFGGFGIYKGGIFFALIIDNILYFKVDESNRLQYESLDSKPFSYEGKNKKMITLSYWEVPIDILENNSKLAQWVEQAVKAAIKAKKPVKKKS